MKLEERSLTPLYRQVMDGIRGDIDAGIYNPGDRIPSEAELSQLYSVSRITIRRAIEELSAAGQLTKKQGKGTYVNPPKLTHKIIQQRSVPSFQQACESSGREARSEMLVCGRVEAWADAAAFLGVAPGSELLHVRSRWNVDGIFVMLLDAYLPCEEFAVLEGGDFASRDLFEQLEQDFGRRPKHTERCTIEIVRALPEVAHLLNITSGEPLFQVDAELLDADQRPVMVTRALLVGDLYAFNIE